MFLLTAIIIVCFAGFRGNGFAQKSYRLTLLASPGQEKVLKKVRVQKSYIDSLSASLAVEEVLSYLFAGGYIAAFEVRRKADSSGLNVEINTGPRYVLGSLRKGNLDEFLIQEVNFREKNFAGKPFRYGEIVRLSDRLLTYCENNGFPFASFRLDSVGISDSVVDAAIHFQKNNKIVIDSLIVKGNARLAKGYLYNYLGIRPGKPYDESLIARAGRKLSELAFVSEIKAPEVVFSPSDAKVYLYLSKRKASYFNGIIGIMPNDQVSGKLLVNGELRLTLLNSFGRGELIDLNWRSISRGTQDLKINLAYPYLFGTPFGLNYRFLLFKQDTSYLTLTHTIGVQFFFRGNRYVKALADIFTSSLLSTSGLETATVLPPWADVSASMFGLESNLENYDYRPNPRKAWYLFASAVAGVKNIKRNAAVNPVLYDSIRLRSTQFKFQVKGGVFIPLIRKTTLWLGTENAWLVNSEIFENELFRFGGLRSLRGFDEDALKASLYSILTLEIRYLFEKNSYFCVFANGAYYERNTRKEYVSDWPYGIGAGVAFETKIGIFTLNYALGSQFGQALSFRQSKIHFGFTNIF